jgi:hypothetical protein
MSSIRETNIETLNYLLIHSFLPLYTCMTTLQMDAVEEVVVRPKGVPDGRVVTPAVAGAVLM